MKKLLLFVLLLNAASAFAEIYTWKDSRGTTHYANNLYDVPKRYVSKAKMLDIATGKKVPIPATAGKTPPAPAAQAPAAAPVQPSPVLPPAVQQPVTPPPYPQQPAALPAPRGTQNQVPVKARGAHEDEE